MICPCTILHVFLKNKVFGMTGYVVIPLISEERLPQRVQREC